MSATRIAAVSQQQSARERISRFLQEGRVLMTARGIALIVGIGEEEARLALIELQSHGLVRFDHQNRRWTNMFPSGN